MPILLLRYRTRTGRPLQYMYFTVAFSENLVDALFQPYQKEIGRSYTRDASYQLLKRQGWRTVAPGPRAPNKADAQTIAESKHTISVQEEKKAP